MLRNHRLSFSVIDRNKARLRHTHRRLRPSVQGIGILGRGIERCIGMGGSSTSQ
ncbi:hypothetical protein [Acidithiobacillus caldus]|uniref:hypothetical protein n=1 Tax=Acidithiobacillus caldus TaxID=33059 RepID=UPI001300CF26|nr:hypothetical protein [Acidithiobacillus caldus]MBU2729649.1 hypothetical protein [Acidithiobacillus caldus]